MCLLKPSFDLVANLYENGVSFKFERDRIVSRLMLMVIITSLTLPSYTSILDFTLG